MPSQKWTKYFREADKASTAWNVIKTMIHTSLFWCVFLWMMPFALNWVETQLGIYQWAMPAQSGWVIWPLFLLCGGIGMFSGVTMAIHGAGTPLPLDGPRDLVVVGPYKYVRNPMAVVGLTQGLLVGIYIGSPLTVLAVFAGGLIWNYWVRPIEEMHLHDLFGDNFSHYEQHVRCWIPRFSPYSP